jgi:hypothetical protein
LHQMKKTPDASQLCSHCMAMPSVDLRPAEEGHLSVGVQETWGWFNKFFCPSWSQSYDFKIYNYNASVLGSRLEYFFKAEQNNFVSKSH